MRRSSLFGDISGRMPGWPQIALPAYWVALSILIIVKAVMVSDLSVTLAFFPHDDSQYVTRAYHFLRGEAFGPYDSHTLSKLPGISFWLAGVRTVGIPHLLAVNILYVAAGLYMLSAMGKAGVGRWLRVAIFAAYLFNPLTMGEEWTRVLRDPLGTGLFAVMLAAMLHLMLALAARTTAWPHLLAFAATFAFALLVREDDKLLWVLLALFGAVLARSAWNELRKSASPARAFILAALLIPAVTAWVSEHLVRSYFEDRYGLPILHDMSEGEFPRLLAAIRGIASGTDNRLVMVPQDTLQKLRIVVPEFAPVIDNLPAVGPHTFSCKHHGVCGEWGSGWMAFWIKDAAGELGLTPDLKSAQQYFRRVRERIEEACKRGDLKCSNKGSGWIPPFELRWTRAYLEEFSTLVKMTLSPDPHTVHEAPILYNVSVKLGRVYQTVTMTDYFDTLAQTSARDVPAQRAYRNPLAGWRGVWEKIFRPFAAVLIVLGVAALICRWTLYPNVPETPLLWIATLFFAFAAFRLAVLSYVAVFIGGYDPRIIFATYTGALLMSPVAIAELVRARRASRRRVI